MVLHVSSVSVDRGRCRRVGCGTSVRQLRQLTPLLNALRLHAIENATMERHGCPIRAPPWREQHNRIVFPSVSIPSVPRAFPKTPSRVGCHRAPSSCCRPWLPPAICFGFSQQPHNSTLRIMVASMDMAAFFGPLRHMAIDATVAAARSGTATCDNTAGRPRAVLPR